MLQLVDSQKRPLYEDTYVNKFNLTDTYISKLSLTNKPGWGQDDKGKPVQGFIAPSLSEEERKQGMVSPKPFRPYVVFDSNPKSPTGFGIVVNRHESSFIVQKRVGAKITKTVLGKTRNMSIDAARVAALKEIQSILSEGISSRKAKKQQESRIPTLAEIVGSYQAELRSRRQAAKENTQKNILSAQRRYETWGWANLPITQITSRMVVEKFDEQVELVRTATEQAFRWAFTAMKLAITNEDDLAMEERREPAFAYNPFNILFTKKKFRSRSEWQTEYEKSGIRNPFNDSNIGKILNVIWDRRKIENNRMACDYLLLTLLMGTRRGELATLTWVEEQPVVRQKFLGGKAVKDDKGKPVMEKVMVPCSTAYLAGKKLPDGSVPPLIWLRDTKNRTDHKLPLVGAALAIMKERKRMAEDAAQARKDQGLSPDPRAIWVFPARSSKCKTGHYTDSKAILEGIRKDTKNPNIRTHDFRRTLGSYADRLTDKSMVKRLLNHRTLSDATTRYDQIPWEDVKDALDKCGVAMLKNAPVVYNALLTPQKPPI